MEIKRSIKVEMMFFLLIALIGSIGIVSYLSIRSIAIAEENAKQSAKAAIQKQAEEFLIQIASLAAEKNDEIFENVRKDASSVAQFAANVFDNPQAFEKEGSNYWKFDDHMVKGNEGQYLNGMGDVSSMFIPNFAHVTDDLKKQVEQSAYLDFIFPKVSKNNQNTVAIYYIDTVGDTRYFPNIGLGNILPASLNPTEDIYFTVANPNNNPERKVVWTPVYDDPAGQGMMISASAPVYAQEGFIGILGIDVTLTNIIKRIEEYEPIEGSYAVLVDSQGGIIALPEHAWKGVVGRDKLPGEIRVNLSSINTDFLEIFEGMKNGSTGFKEVNMEEDNVKKYVAYAPLKDTGFSLGIVVEEQLLLEAVTSLEKEIHKSAFDLIYTQIIPLSMIILVVASIVGGFFINRITRPIQELTKTTQEISKGNYEVALGNYPQNEIGQLASTFRQMIDELKKSRKHVEEHNQELEIKVGERTKELQLKNEELEKFNKLSVGRELKMVELKKTIEDLENKLQKK